MVQEYIVLGNFPNKEERIQILASLWFSLCIYTLENPVILVCLLKAITCHAIHKDIYVFICYIYQNNITMKLHNMKYYNCWARH